MSLKKIKNYDYVFIALLLNALFFYPMLFSDKTLFFRDIHRWFYPMKYFLARTLQSGSIPLWCPHYFCGSPFMSDLQSGLFYPVSLIFCLLPFPWSFNIYVILHFFLAFCFFYLFLKGLGLSPQSAIITSISYCYGSYAIASVNTLNNLSTLIWLPAILWSYQRATAKSQKSGFFFTVLFLCMAILGGEPQLFIMIIGLLLFYGLTSASGKTSNISLYIKNIATILLLITSAILITIVQVGPAYLDYQLSARLGGITYEDAARFSLNLKTLKHLIFPLPFHADFATNSATLNNFFPGNGQVPWLLTIYPGLIILPAALFGLFFNFSKKILIWLAVFLITLILAIGNNTPIFFVFYKIFPFFRFPEKFMFLASFSLLVMAAYGLDRLISVLKQKGVRPNLLFFLIALVLFTDLFSTHRNLNPLCESRFYQRHHPFIKPILDDPETFRIYSDPEIAIPASVQDTILNRHIKWQMHLMPNLGIIDNLSHVDGTTGLELRYQYLITELLLKPWSEKIRFLKLANVKYIISSENLDKKPELKGQIEKINGLVYRVKDFLPRAWIVGELNPIITGTIDELMDVSFDPAFSALSKGKIVDRYNRPFFKKIDNIVYDPNGTIHIELTAEAPGILILLESSYPGWQVFVDGQEKECLWLNLLFQGVEIGKGKHQIDFIYRPKYFDLFILISLISLLIFLFVWSYSFISDKKHRKNRNCSA